MVVCLDTVLRCSLGGIFVFFVPFLVRGFAESAKELRAIVCIWVLQCMVLFHGAVRLG